MTKILNHIEKHNYFLPVQQNIDPTQAQYNLTWNCSWYQLGNTISMFRSITPPPHTHIRHVPLKSYINKIHLTQLQQFYCISMKTVSLYWTINMIWQFLLEFFLHVQKCTMHTYIHVIAFISLCSFTNIILRVFTEKILNDQQQMFCIQYLTLSTHYSIILHNIGLILKFWLLDNYLLHMYSKWFITIMHTFLQ